MMLERVTERGRERGRKRVRVKFGEREERIGVIGREGDRERR